MTHLTELPYTENNLAAAMLATALKEKRDPAIAFAQGKPIPRNCLPRVTKPAEQVTGNQYLILVSLKSGAKKRAEIAEEIGAPKNSVSSSLQALKLRKLVHIQRTVKRNGRTGNNVGVYGITKAGRKAVEARDE